MNNYKAEQEKQDEKFDERFLFKSTAVGDPIAEYVNSPNIIQDTTPFKSYLLTRDLALLEAFNKDVEAILVDEINIAREEPELAGGKTSRLTMAYMRINSLLKDYNINK